jgi:hypothetical protein
MTNSTTTPVSDGTKSIIRFRWIGYGLLLFALVDIVALLIPPRFTDPSWELQTIGQLVERAPVPLIGMALVFYGEQLGRSFLESLLLRLLSWLSILLVIAFLLLVPLGVVNTFRINAQTAKTIDTRTEQQFKQLDQIQQQIDKSPPEALQDLAKKLKEAGVPEIKTDKPEDLKREVANRVQTFKAGIQEQAKQEKLNRSRGVFKSAVKWNIGAVITSVLFFAIWKTSRWAR